MRKVLPSVRRPSAHTKVLTASAARECTKVLRMRGYWPLLLLLLLLLLLGAAAVAAAAAEAAAAAAAEPVAAALAS